MLVEHCDICGEKLSTYRDQQGIEWHPVSFKEKRYKKEIYDFTGKWSDYFGICGRCRKAIATYKEEKNNDST